MPRLLGLQKRLEFAEVKNREVIALRVGQNEIEAHTLTARCDLPALRHKHGKAVAGVSLEGQTAGLRGAGFGGCLGRRLGGRTALRVFGGRSRITRGGTAVVVPEVANLRLGAGAESQKQECRKSKGKKSLFHAVSFQVVRNDQRMSPRSVESTEAYSSVPAAITTQIVPFSISQPLRIRLRGTPS